jgi:hypothetical protein
MAGQTIHCRLCENRGRSNENRGRSKISLCPVGKLGLEWNGLKIGLIYYLTESGKRSQRVWRRAS